MGFIFDPDRTPKGTFTVYGNLTQQQALRLTGEDAASVRDRLRAEGQAIVDRFRLTHPTGTDLKRRVQAAHDANDDEAELLALDELRERLD